MLNGYPGEFITVARRKDNTWYLGSMTDWTPRDMEVTLNFLGSGAYKARIYSDGLKAAQNASDLSTRATVFQAGDRVTVHLASGGGLAAVFTPISSRQ
jgi:alpha-glucosidase